MKKKLISLLTAVSIFMSLAGSGVMAEGMLGLSGVAMQRGSGSDRLSPYTSAVSATPATYKFTFNEQNFVMLGGYVGTDGKNAGYMEKGGKKHFLILADQSYGRFKFHDVESGNDPVWSVTDENKIGYWLNNEFISDSYSGTKLPDEMIENLTEYEWHTEPTLIEGYTSEYVTESKLALMSDYEAEKYSGMYGVNIGAQWWLRTASCETRHSTRNFVVSNSTAGRTDAAATNSANGFAVRPIFWLSEDFFIENEITAAGRFVYKCLGSALTKEQLLSEGVYSANELDELFTPPSAVVDSIDGNPVVGNSLTVDYTYTSELGFDEDTEKTVIKWLHSDSENGEYIEIDGAEGDTYILTDADEDMYIKASVTPFSKALINAQGSAAESAASVGPIYGNTYIGSAVEDINSKDKDTVMESLALYNHVFDLDLTMSGLSDTEKADAIEIFADMNSSGFNSLVKNYTAAMVIAQLNAATDDSETEEFLNDSSLELDLTQFNSLTDKSVVLAGMRGKGFNTISAVSESLSSLTMLQAINEADAALKAEIIMENKESFSADLSYIKQDILISATNTMKETYTSLEILDSKLSAAIEEIESLLENESMLGLTAYNGRLSTQLEGAVESTPAKYAFSYGGQNFIFLDTKTKEVEGDSKEYYLIFADQLYGTRKFHDVTENHNQVWSTTDKNKLGYWLNNEFISESYEGDSLPDNMLSYIDYKNVWHTEPASVEGYTTEGAMLSISGISVMSVQELKDYVGMYGYKAGGSSNLAWLRTSRTNDSAAVQLIATSGNEASLSAGSTSSYYVRPIFWLSEDFFKENKIQSAGVFSAASIDSQLTREELTALEYTDDEINNWFKKPTAVITSLSGEAVVGETLTLNYTYSSECGFKESGTVINWYRSSDAAAWGEPIAQGSTYTLTEADAGMYITAGVTPKALANINPVGDEVRASRIVGSVYGKAQMQAVVDAIDDVTLWTDELIAEKITPHNEVLGLDISFDGLTTEEKSEALAIFANSAISDLEGLRKDFLQAQMIVQLNAETDETAASAILTDSKMQLTTTQFSELGSKAYVLSNVMGKSFSKTADFEKAFYDAVAVTRVNESDQTNILQALRDNTDRFTAELFLLDDYKLGKVGSNILGTYTDFSTLDSAVTAAVATVNSQITETQTPEDGSNSYNDTGGGGGGGGGGKVTLPSENETVINPPIENTSPEDTSPEDTSIYKDMSSAHWGYEAVRTLSDKEILSGDGNGNFRPEDTLKREEFVKMIVLAFASDTEVKETSFTDVAADAWYAQYVKAAVAGGLINGISESAFGTGREISRQDMALIIYRALGESLKTDKTADFADMNSVSDYAVEAVNALYAAGLLSGDGTNVNPHGNATRAMAAKMVYSAMRYMEGDIK